MDPYLAAITAAILTTAALVVVHTIVRARRQAPPEWLDSRLTRRVLVHTVDGTSIEGSLIRAAPDGLILAAARYLDDAEPKDLLGETYIPRPRVGFIQHVDRT